jgi:hypothetical protein
MDYKYIIFDLSEIDKINFEQVMETSVETLRLSVDGTKTFVKWIGDEPSFISTLQTKSIIYNNEDILNILDGPIWQKIDISSGTTIN